MANKTFVEGILVFWEGNMADTPTTTPVESGDNISNQQSAKPRAMLSTFVADDTDYHFMQLDMSVKGGLTYGATNPSNKGMVITLYGAFESGVDPGDEAAFPIDVSGGHTVGAGASAHEVTLDKFPYYLIRCKFADVPDGETVVIKACSWEA